VSVLEDTEALVKTPGMVEYRPAIITPLGKMPPGSIVCQVFFFPEERVPYELVELTGVLGWFDVEEATDA